MKNVLVLGATGFIGRYLIEQLQKKCCIIGYDCFVEQVDYPLIDGNFVVETEFEHILKSYKIDTVYHLISTTIPKEDTTDIDVEIMNNVVPTLRLLEAMRKVGTKNMIFVSSGGTVYGESKGKAHMTTDMREPICGYGMQKLVIEDYIQFYNRKYDMKCKIARISNIYGVPPRRPRVQGLIPILINKLFQDEEITILGDTIRDYIHISDVIDALIKIGEYKGDSIVFNVGSGQGTSITDIMSIIEAQSQRKFSRVNNQHVRNCDVQENILDIQDTEKELNWYPRINLIDGIRQTVMLQKDANNC